MRSQYHKLNCTSSRPTEALACRLASDNLGQFEAIKLENSVHGGLQNSALATRNFSYDRPWVSLQSKSRPSFRSKMSPPKVRQQIASKGPPGCDCFGSGTQNAGIGVLTMSLQTTSLRLFLKFTTFPVLSSSNALTWKGRCSGCMEQHPPPLSLLLSSLDQYIYILLPFMCLT